MADTINENRAAAKGQRIQQFVTFALTVVIAAATIAYVWVNYQLLQAARESNRIEGAALKLQQDSALTRY
jgi:hypothetical protein